MKHPNPATAMQRKLKQAYRSTKQYQVDQLMEQQSRWLRKCTISENKLAETRKQIDKLLLSLAEAKQAPVGDLNQ